MMDTLPVAIEIIHSLILHRPLVRLLQQQINTPFHSKQAHQILV